MHLELAKTFWQNHLRPGDFVIDATCGQGKDTLFLCQLGMHVVGLDIQPEAIAKTQTLLAQHAYHPPLHCMSHVLFPPLPASPRLIVYNLGYLPTGNKNFTTRTETTLQSVALALTLLSPDGALSITCYPGHPEGEREEKELLAWAEKLPKLWRVSHHRLLNRSQAPSLLWIKT